MTRKTPCLAVPATVDGSANWRSLNMGWVLTKQRKTVSLYPSSHISKVRTGEAKREAEEDRLTFDRWRLVNPWVQHYLRAHTDSLHSCHLLLLLLSLFFLCPLTCWRIKPPSRSDTISFLCFPFDSQATMYSRVPTLVRSCQNAVQHSLQRNESF